MKAKKYRLLTFLSLVILLPLFSGCKKEKQPDYSFELSSSSIPSDGSSSVSIEPKGDVISISFITSNTSHSWDYRIVSGSSWIDGEKSGNRVTLTFAANESDASRSGSVTFTLGDNSRTITFTQEAIDFSFTFTSISSYFDDGVLSFPTIGESVTFEFSGGTSGYDWDFELGGGSDWITATRDGNNITLTTDANETDATRSTTLTLNFGTKSETINISQEAIDFNFTITSTSPYFDNGAIAFPPPGESVVLQFDGIATAGYDWSFELGSSSDWVTATRDGNNLTLIAGGNETDAPRSTTLTLTFGTKSTDIVVTQEKSNNYSETVNDVTFEMIYVEGGTFMMGSDDWDAFDWEQPVHEVTLSSYYIGKFEVTQKLWVAIMGSNPSKLTGDENRPVEMVFWYDAQEFIDELNRLTGKTYCLPTEAQWEFAARGGTKSRGYKYSGSDNIDDVAWYSVSKTHPVGAKAPNELGIYDMSGNVYEWCSDWYDANYYSSSPQSNPTGPSSGSRRVMRGGSWTCDARRCRSAYRSSHGPGGRGSNVGLRLAIPVE